MRVPLDWVEPPERLRDIATDRGMTQLRCSYTRYRADRDAPADLNAVPDRVISWRAVPGVPTHSLRATEHVPSNDRELACHDNGSDVIAVTTGDAFIERPQRSGSTHSLPCGFDRHSTSMSASLLGNSPMSWTAFTRRC